MKVLLKDFLSVIPDNDIIYFSTLEAVIESVDELAILQVSRIPDGYQFRLSSSLPKYVPLLIEEILKIHNVFNIHLDLSKSIKSSGALMFKITM